MNDFRNPAAEPPGRTSYAPPNVAPDPSDPQRSLTGALLNERYEVGRCLAIGGCSLVYDGQDVLLQRQVGLKVMMHNVHEGIEDRFLREAIALARTRHPDLLQIYDVCKYEHMSVLVLESVPGSNLEFMLRKHRTFSIAFTVELGIRVGRVLIALKDEALSHADIKPANLSFFRDIHDEPCVKVLDLSACQRLDATRQEPLPLNKVDGTLGYGPREQFEGYLTSRADVHAAGATMLELLTGVPRGPDWAVSDAVRCATAHGLPKRLIKILAKALAPYEERYEPEELVAALEAFARSARIPRGAAALAQVKARDGRRVSASLCSLLVIAVLAGMYARDTYEWCRSVWASEAAVPVPPAGALPTYRKL